MIGYLFSSLFALQLIGCKHQFRIESYPPGATVYHDGEEIGTTPMETTLQWYPFKRMPLEVRLPNYRPVFLSADKQINARILTREIVTFRYKKLLGRTPRTTHHVHLIREHGPAGTWTPDDAKKSR